MAASTSTEEEIIEALKLAKRPRISFQQNATWLG